MWKKEKHEQEWGYAEVEGQMPLQAYVKLVVSN
jgi:hypothetical protein